MARKNTLIHLHGSTKLEDASKLILGEIAVTHADTELNTELVVKTKVEGVDKLVYIPSLDRVANEITVAVAKEAKDRSDADTALGARIDELAGTGATSVAGQIEALRDDLQGQIDTKVDTEAYNTKMGELATELSGLTDAVTKEAKDRSDADTALADRIAAFEGTGATSVAGQIEALRDELQDEIDAKVDTEAYNTKMGELATELSGLTDAVTKEAKDRSDADTALAEQISAETEAREELSSNFDLLKGRVDTFLDSEAIEGTVDTLHEIQNWMSTAGADVTALTKAIADEAKDRSDADTALGARIDELAGTGATSVAGQIEALKEELQDEIDAKVDTEAYNTKMGELATELSGLTDAVAKEAKDRADADTALDAAMIKTIVVENTEVNKITAKASTNTVTFNFDDMVIDCGTYDSAE